MLYSLVASNGTFLALVQSYDPVLGDQNVVATRAERLTRCPPVAQTCRSAGSSALRLKDHTSIDTSDRLGWRWSRGESTSTMEFADPTLSTEYAFCLYAGPALPLIAETAVPSAGSRWSATGTRGYKYIDRTAEVLGINKVRLKSSTTDATKIVVKGRGRSLSDLTLPLPTPVLVRMVNGTNDLCWESSYAGAQILKNEPGLFKGRGP